MTINTQVHLEDGTKSTDTMCGSKTQGKLTKKRRKISAAQKEKAKQARRELVALTKFLKAQQQLKAGEAKTEDEALAILAKRPNELLTEHYLRTTGATELRTFKQWKDSGYYVQKGETALRVWGTPFDAKSSNTVDTPDGEHIIESTYELYPVVPLYSNLQVKNSDNGEGDTETVKQDPTPVVDPAEIPHRGDAQIGAPARAPCLPSPANAPTKQGNPKLAARLRAMADKLQKDIDHAFCERLENTPKRIAEAARARQKGYRCQRTQQALNALAALHEQGNIPTVLNNIKTKKAVYDLLALRQEGVSNGFHDYYVETSGPVYTTPEANALWALINTQAEDNKARETLQQKKNALTFANIPGYFPTPAEVIERMCTFADVQDGHTILEPEAGSGAILDYLAEHFGDVSCIAYEVNHNLFEVVNGSHPCVQHANFLTVDPAEVADRVLMNPPFERLKDVDHVQHAFKFLKPGGTLVAIMSPSAFFRKDKKAQGFRAWLAARNGYAHDLPEGSFKSSGTSVRTKIVVIEKPITTGSNITVH